MTEAQPPARRLSWLPMWLLFAAAFGSCLAFQNFTGAYDSDLAGDPDEAAHAVTALMVRDYLANAPGAAPLAFAEAYYAAFPKVALGHYPPFYYLVAGLWLLPAPGIGALLLLQAALAACLAAAVFAIGRRWAGNGAALTAALWILLLPVTQKLLQQVMADLLLALLCLISAACWMRYLAKPSARSAMAFGIIAALAILTKGSAMLLALVPPLASAFTGRWDLFKRLDWWLAAVPVAVLAGPWMVYSVRFTQEGMQDLTPWAYAVEAFAFYAEALPAVAGVIATIAIVALAAARVIARIRGRPMNADESVAWAMLIGGAAVLLFIPAGSSSRYLMPLLAPMALLLTAAASQLLARVRRPRLARAGIGLAAFALVAIETWEVPFKRITGFGEAARVAGSIPGVAFRFPNVWLVSSDARGEGAVIAAAAFDLPQRPPPFDLQVVRASKELASSDWMGRGYATAFATEAGLLEHLDKRRINVVLVDASVPLESRVLHHEQILRALSGASREWMLEREIPVRRGAGHDVGRVKIFRRIPGS